MRWFALALLITLIVPNARAYPIFYSCNSDGQIREHVDTQELQTLVLAATDEDSLNAKILKLCGGIHECFSVLKQALLLTKQSIEISDEILQDEVQNLISKKGAELNESVDSSLPTMAKNVMEMAQDVYACRKTQEDLPEDSFRLYNLDASNQDYGAGGLILQNRIDNEFRHVSGEQRDGTTKKIQLSDIRNVIETAVAAGMDPYAALAVNFWEEGSVDKHFTLDYNPMITSLGCKTTPAERGPARKAGDTDTNVQRRADIVDKYQSKGQPFIYDYSGQVYTFESGVHESSRLNEMLEAYVPRNGNVSKHPVLYCAQYEGDFMADLDGNFIATGRPQVDKSTWSINRACCLKVPYDNYDAISDLLATKFVADRLQSIPLGKNDPAYMLQSFNGFTSLMGISERGTVEKPIVGQFRLGLNLKDSPQYGYQGMDLILNTFMNNPAIRALVQNAENRTGKKPKSALCIGKKSGAYAIDSEFYVNKQKQALRFGALIGKDWDTMSASQKSLMKFEWDLMAYNKDKTNPKLSDDENAAYRKLVDLLGNQPNDAAKWAFYQNQIYPTYRKTLYQTSLKTWGRVSDDDVRETRRKVWEVNNALETQ